MSGIGIAWMRIVWLIGRNSKAPSISPYCSRGSWDQTRGCRHKSLVAMVGGTQQLIQIRH